MSQTIKHIVIIGGGTAGWITAGILAAEHITPDSKNSIKITLIESTEIAPIGVGEGTWPSMRETLKAIGINEADFLNQCDASFKQGSKFVDWVDTNKPNDTYYHPFTLPEDYFELNLANHWQLHGQQIPFADAVTFQSHLCHKNLAPKQITTPAYSFIGNYGYHLDAGKFAPFIRKHCIEKLGVIHIDDMVEHVCLQEDDDIQSVHTINHGEIAGDLFIDCSGLHGLLLDKTYQIPFISCKDILCNDTALAAQVPYDSPAQNIQSATVSTAVKNGWIWDIGLQSRRGVGHVYSSAHCNEQDAKQTLIDYIEKTSPKASIDNLTIRKLSINPGYREVLWHKNAVAIGMAAGFIEPLEASAIAMIELSAKFISTQLPRNRAAMNNIAERFNHKFLNRWEQIIDFLKLHYILSKRRDSQYWQDCTSLENVPQRLLNKLALWETQAPYTYDSMVTEELFPSASYQYIYYGMGGKTDVKVTNKIHKQQNKVTEIIQQNNQKTSQLLNMLPNNRELLNKIKQFGLQKI